MIKGVISDMDGVILDSEKLYVRFWCEAGNFYGYPMQKFHALSIRSMARPYAIERLQGFFGEDFDYDKVRNKRVELMDSFVEKNGIDAKPGAETLLRYLKEKGIKTGIATSNSKELVSVIMDKYNLSSCFDSVRTACEVEKGKPFPDIYLKVAEDIGVNPAKCLVFEDVLQGVKAGIAAGMRVCAVSDSHSQYDLAAIKREAHSFINDFKDLL